MFKIFNECLQFVKHFHWKEEYKIILLNLQWLIGTTKSLRKYKEGQNFHSFDEVYSTIYRAEINVYYLAPLWYWEFLCI